CVPPLGSNGFAAPWLELVEVLADDDFEDDSDCRASIRDPAAPSASNMAVLRHMPRKAARHYSQSMVSKRRATRKTPTKQRFFAIAGAAPPGNSCPQRQIFPPPGRRAIDLSPGPEMIRGSDFGGFDGLRREAGRTHSPPDGRAAGCHRADNDGRTDLHD